METRPGRRNEHALIELARLPWWASGAVAALVFAALRWLAPSLAGSEKGYDEAVAMLRRAYAAD